MEVKVVSANERNVTDMTRKKNLQKLIRSPVKRLIDIIVMGEALSRRAT
ncbi:hypothetical protein Mcup_1204 [Metallosphaera cuprina Ar-4]|uniref:Uncharacterized protein n=1 Tax=Metallosphaera cuprina (strain Ar-4) TaxID=1006006 RepID=F4G3B2_METCR|nr:hypothetical protein Mcup_1204 [Metallosphaera cuprina Ar-4]